MLLQLDHLHKSFYKSDGGVARKVLDDLSLDLKPAESLAIVGPSGSGKSTLLNLIAALDQADQGTIRFDGKELSTFSSKQLDTYRNQSIGIVFQLHHLLPQLTLLENVLLPALPNKKNEQVNERAEELLNKVGVWPQRNQKQAELSGGECQRTAVVRALINQPKLILADEPTGALDEENANKLVDLLIDMHQSYQTALILVTHSATLADRMDRKLILRNGKLHDPKAL